MSISTTLVALDSPTDGASEISFQTTTVATSGLLVSLKVMKGRGEGKIETWSGLDRSKDAAKVRQCAIIDRRTAIDDRRLLRMFTSWVGSNGSCLSHKCYFFHPFDHIQMSEFCNSAYNLYGYYYRLEICHFDKTQFEVCSFFNYF